MIICLETSTLLCSVALCDSDGVISLKESDESKSHASRLTIFIDELLSEAGLKAGDLEAIAVSRGPGSYTGLRIGVSVAKGIAYASSIPLIGVDTTLSMFHGLAEYASERYGTNDLSYFVPMLDARRMEVYYSIFAGDGKIVRKVSAEVIDENSFSDISPDVKMVFFGDGAIKCRDILKGENKIFDDIFRISAGHMYKPAFKAFKEGRFEDIAYFEPFYLKDFIISQPKKNILGR
jgi:tRNA threonylcarbamoyladenosine biosynthesis protein TsaB